MIRLDDIKPIKFIFHQDRKSLSLVLVFLFIVIGCAEKLPTTPNSIIEKPPVQKQPGALKELPPLVRIDSLDFPSFRDSYNYDNLEHCIQNSLNYLNNRRPDSLIHFGKDPYKVSHLIRSLTRFLEVVREKPSVEKLNQFIADNYQVYRAAGKDGHGQVLFTGYYEPFLTGSPIRTEEYRYPVYSMPDDLISIDLSNFSKDLSGKRINGRFNGKTVVPYYNRRQIESDPGFAGKAKPIAWVNDRIDLFFLHIQGSGRIQLTNGESINVHYHAVNGRRYRSIGKLLIDQGKISREEMSMQKIREYLKHHPDQLDEILQYNNSFVFFKIEEKGPLGYLGVPLTPARSAAFDRQAFPPAALAFISTRIPIVDGNMKINSWNEHSGFVLNQDTGGAIKGPGRADLFWGSGPYAEVAAGHLKNPGELYFLILKPQSM